jgi:MFS family permease
VLLVVAVLLSASAALAIAILLFGDFGETEGRILWTTALLAGYALLALPASMLVDQRRLPALAAAGLALAAAGAALAVAAIWMEESSDAHGKAIGTVSSFLVASAQVSALVLRRPERDRALVRGLFVASSVLAAVVAAMIAVLLWAEIDSERYGRALGALVVLDVLAVALQPTLARVRPKVTPFALRLVLDTGESVDVEVAASDLASAAARAIRDAERHGRRVSKLELSGTRELSGDR